MRLPLLKLRRPRERSKKLFRLLKLPEKLNWLLMLRLESKSKIERIKKEKLKLSTRLQRIILKIIELKNS